ncbi:hypothetical protein FJ651_10835 [Paucihalobacter ruber]|uniref:Uncharacterized protein n=1 Tax=Paucihalobacter ruber TaxID=2567861 RepID=A0A506PG22_9FLAO|nr:hypothetical protein [Paucihalobacter ruber]TPV32803.1 hypothetical protein FJ651_10835 [Paucihalobacter ruber]
MIKFFRNIRQNLLNKGKTSKYFKYAIGEIVLVVIGILIALQINTWNEDRLMKLQIKTNLINLSKAIQQDYDLLKEIEEINDFRYNSINQVLRWAEIPLQEIDTIPIKLMSTSIWEGAVPETFDAEFYKKSFRYVQKPRMMIVQTYAMEELKNSGLYSKLDNQKLKNALNKYYSDLKWFFGRDELNKNDFVDEYENYINNKYSLTVLDVPFITNPLESIKKDAGLVVRLRNLKDNAGWRIYGAKTSKNRAELLLKEIQNEIDKI